MDQRTQRLLALLGSDMCGAICDRLRAGAVAKTELAEDLRRSSRDIASTLDSLHLAGLVRYTIHRSGGPGRPQQVWELVATEELEKLEAYVKQMQRRLVANEKVPSRNQK